MSPRVRQRPAVVVVGPQGGRAGGVATFQRNLLHHSSVGDRWRLIPFDISRPDKRGTVVNDRYLALLSEGPGYVVRALAVTGGNLLRFPWTLLRRRPAAVQIQGGDRWGFWEAVLYAAMARALRIRTVMRFGGSFDHFWNDSPGWMRAGIRRGLRVPHAIVVQSEGWRRFYREVCGRDDLAILPNGVTDPDETPDSRDARDPRTEGVRALFISLAEAERKGIDALLAAVPRWGARVHVTIVGGNDAVRRRVEEAGLADQVTIRPPLGRDAMRQAYAASDLLLLPSLAEGFPNSMLEAMAAALPVVATRVGAIPEVIEDGVDGLLMEPRDVDALVAHGEALAGDPGLRRRLGDAAQAKVRRSYTLDRVLERLEAVWAGHEAPRATAVPRRSS